MTVRLVQVVRDCVHREDKLVRFSDEVFLQRHGPCIEREDLSISDLRNLGNHALAYNCCSLQSASLVYDVEMQCALREEMY